MNPLRPLFLCAGFCLFAASIAAHAQLGIGESSSKNAQWVTQEPARPVTLPTGKSVEAQLKFTIEPDKHINSNKPNSELLIPTRLRLEPSTDITVAGIAYPPGKDFTFPFDPDEKLNVYTGTFDVGVKLLATRKAPQGPVRMRGELRYQACNDRACFPPKTLPVTLDVTVVQGATGVPRRNPAQSPHIHQ